MTCPICAFPGNDAAAIRCANCGFSMRPAPPNPEPAVIAPEPGPIPDAHGLPPLPPPHVSWPPVAWSPSQDAQDAAVPASWPPISGPPTPDPLISDPPVSGSPDSGPPYGMPVPGAPVSGPPVSLSPAPGPPRGLYAAPQRSRAGVPLTVIVAVLVLAGAVIAVVRMTGGTRSTPASAGSTAGAAWPKIPGQSTGQSASQPTGQSTGQPASQGQPTRVAAPGAATGDPRAQAAAVDAVLDASVASRTKLNAAIARVDDCTAVEQAVADLRAVGTERQAQLDAVAAADLSALPEGEQLRGLLTDALRYSLAADRGFVLWGQAVQAGGCDGGGRADYQADYQEAQRQSRLAGDAKARFLVVWNPVAARHGLPDRSSAGI
ncbi:hypothetical protein ACQEVZ_56935 [Dactylosporangium sp. CA-152071]|uniref:hypothetical protein n=1 Tax=Dactylosporangium sp. CA-152071 TaxID=3239933 RepID=UPI003D8E33B2